MESLGETVKQYSYKAIKQFSKENSYKAIKQYSYSESPEAKKAQSIAWKAVQKLNAPSSYQFFLKCAWHLSESTIFDIIDRANSSSKIKSPERWAVSALYRELNS